jgi:CheY-like chemotaxis protein
MSELPPRVLIADDQPGVLEALRLLLQGEGFFVETAGSRRRVTCRRLRRVIECPHPAPLA